MKDTTTFNDEQLKHISGGEKHNQYFNDATELLKQAGDRAWSVLLPENKLWDKINNAEKADSESTRMVYIEDALFHLEFAFKRLMDKSDYDFIYEKLTKSAELTEK